MTLHLSPACPGTFHPEGKQHYRCDTCGGVAYRCPQVELVVQVDALLRSLAAEGQA